MNSYHTSASARWLWRAFTLIELVVAIAILSIIMLSVFIIYSNLIAVNRKIEQTRVLQEQTRLITETIATDIRTSGIDFSGCGFPSMEPSRCLATKSGAKYLLQQKNVNGKYGNCLDAEKSFPCQVMRDVDIPLSSDAADVRDLRFLVTGTAGSGVTNENTEGKVQLIFDIGIANRKWVSPEVAKASVMTIQTTVSEKIYKDN